MIVIISEVVSLAVYDAKVMQLSHCICCSSWTGPD